MLARLRKSAEERDEGFTLIELLVVIIIIGILAAIAIPVFLNQRKKGYDAQAKSDLRNAATIEETILTDTNAYVTCDAVAGATSCASKLTSFKASPSATIAVAASGSNGYCAFGRSSSGSYFVYDSQGGGLSGTAYADFATATAGATGTSCAVGKPGTLG